MWNSLHCQYTADLKVYQSLATFVESIVYTNPLIAMLPSVLASIIRSKLSNNREICRTNRGYLLSSNSLSLIQVRGVPYKV